MTFLGTPLGWLSGGYFWVYQQKFFVSDFTIPCSGGGGDHKKKKCFLPQYLSSCVNIWTWPLLWGKTDIFGLLSLCFGKIGAKIDGDEEYQVIF